MGYLSFSAQVHVFVYFGIDKLGFVADYVSPEKH